MLAVREFKTGAELLDNVRRLNGVFRAYGTVKSPWQLRYEQISLELGAVKAERDRLTKELAEIIGKESGQDPAVALGPQPIPMAKIISVVCQFYGVPRNDLLSDRRTANLIRPRHVAMYLARAFTHNSVPAIARLMNRECHTSVVHALRSVEHKRQMDAGLDNEIKHLSAMLTGADETEISA